MNKKDKRQQSDNGQVFLGDHPGDSGLRDIDDCDIMDIYCDGKCEMCLQRKWCLLTPGFRYVK